MVLSAMAFHEKAGRSQGNSGFIVVLFFFAENSFSRPSSHCRHAGRPQFSRCCLFLLCFNVAVLVFFIAGLLYRLCFEHVDNLGAYTASRRRPAFSSHLITPVEKPRVVQLGMELDGDAYIRFARAFHVDLSSSWVKNP